MWKHKIYPEELQLTSEDKTDKDVNFLDLHLTIVNKRLIYCLYDKRDDFNFNIVNFPNLSGNIPTRQSYVFLWLNLYVMHEVVKFFKDFVIRVKVLTKKLLSQGFTLIKLQQTYNKFIFK